MNAIGLLPAASALDRRTFPPVTIAPEMWTVADPGNGSGLALTLLTAPLAGRTAVLRVEYRLNAGAAQPLSGVVGAYTVPAPFDQLISVALRAVDARGAGPWSDEKVILLRRPVLWWSPSNLPDLIAWNATDDASIARDGAGRVSRWTSADGAVTAVSGATGSVGAAIYDPVAQVVRGNNARNPLQATLPYTMAGPGAGVTFAFAIQPLNDGSGRAWIGSSTGSLTIAPDVILSSNGGASAPLRNSTDPRIVVITGERDGSDTRLRRIYMNGRLIASLDGSVGMDAATNVLRILGMHYYPSDAANATAALQWLSVLPGVIGKEDRQRLEGWMRANLPLVSGVSLLSETPGDNGGLHPWATEAPTAATATAPSSLSVSIAEAPLSAGDTATAFVTVEGSPAPTIAYQWELDGIDIPGATDVSYVTTDAGALRVRVLSATNSAGSIGPVTSAPVTVTAAAVATGPAMMAAPTVAATGSTSLSVTLAAGPDDGGAPITAYDIRWSTDQTVWTAVSGVPNPHAITGLAPGSLYYVQNRAVNVVDAGAWSSSASAITSAAAPAVFSNDLWFLEETAGGGAIDITLLGLPADHGAAITAVERQLDGGAWVALAGVAPGETHVIGGLTAGQAYDVRLRAVNSAGAGQDSPQKIILLSGGAALWAPSSIADLIAWDATDGASVTRDGSNLVTGWASSVGAVTASDGAPGQVGAALYDPVAQVVRGNNARIPLQATLPYTLGGMGEAATFAFAIQPMDDGSGHAWLGSSNGSLNIAPPTMLNATMGAFNSLYQGADARIVIVTAQRDAGGARTFMAYLNGRLIASVAPGNGFDNATSVLNILGISYYGSDAQNATAALQWLSVMPGVIGKEDRQRLEGWMKWNTPLVSGINLLSETEGDNGGLHPWRNEAPTAAPPPPFALDAGPDAVSAETTLAPIVDGYSLTQTADGQMWAGEAFVATPGAAYRLTGSVKAPAGRFPLVRVGRDVALLPQGVPEDPDHDFDIAPPRYPFVVERTIEADGTAQPFTLDFTAPRDLLFAGVRLPNALDGEAVEVTGLTLTPAPETVAIGATATTLAIEHDGVVFRLRHRVSGDPVTVGRYAVDGQYWALNDDPADPVEVWQTETAGRGVGMIEQTNRSYAEYGFIPGSRGIQGIVVDPNTGVVSYPIIDYGIGKLHDGAALNMWQGTIIVGVSQGSHGFDARVAPASGNNPYHASLNVEPSANGDKPIVFETAMGADWSAAYSFEADRTAAPREATLVKQVGLDMLHSPQGKELSERFVTLTIVEAAPVATALRAPSVLRGAKAPKVTTADINYAALPRLATPAALENVLPPFSELEYIASRPQNANSNVWPNAGPVIGRSSGGMYGRELSKNWGFLFAALLYDHYTVAQQRRLADLIVQFGVDIAAFVYDPVMRPAITDGEGLGWYGPVLRMAAALCPGVAWLTDAADAVAHRRLAEDWGIQRVPQGIIDRDLPLIAIDANKSASMPYPQAALGMPEWSQFSTFDIGDWGLGKAGDAVVNAAVSAAYRGQNYSGSLFQMLAAWRIPEMRAAWNRDLSLEYFDRAFDMDQERARQPGVGLTGDIILNREKAAWIANRSLGEPVSMQRWGLEYIKILGTTNLVDLRPVIRPAYPGVTGIWIDLATAEFGVGVLANGAPTSYAVDMTPRAYGDMTTTGALPAGVTLDAATGVISLSGTQVATPLRWVKIDATNASGTASAIVAIEIADNFLRTFQLRTIQGKALAFQAEIQGGAGGGGTLYWVMYDEEPMALNALQPRPYGGAKPRPTAAQIEAGAAGAGSVLFAAGSLATVANGVTDPFGPAPATVASGQFYAASLLWKPTTGAAPAPLHINLKTL